MLLSPNATLTIFEIEFENGSSQFCDGIQTVTETVIEVSIEDHQTSESRQKEIGTTRDVFTFSGRLVNPKYFPLSYNQQYEAKLSYKIGYEEKEYTGKCLITPTVSSRLKLESVFGDYILGEIELDV